jgi:hypothetical protein
MVGLGTAAVGMGKGLAECGRLGQARHAVYNARFPTLAPAPRAEGRIYGVGHR